MKTNVLQIAKEVFAIEARTISDLGAKLNADFEKSIELILRTKGRLVVSGMGKSGHIGAKIAATHRELFYAPSGGFARGFGNADK